MNNFPIYAEVPERHKEGNKNFIVINPNKKQGGYNIFFFEYLKPDAMPVTNDWSLELEDAFILAENEYNIAESDWKNMR